MKTQLLTAALLGLLVATASPAVFADHHKDHGNKKGMKTEHHMKADKDGDGALSYDEFINMKKERFNEMDANKDGKISKEEMREAHKKYRKKFKKTGQKLCDKDKKGADKDK